jgi:hypothetical protein
MRESSPTGRTGTSWRLNGRRVAAVPHGSHEKYNSFCYSSRVAVTVSSFRCCWNNSAEKMARSDRECYFCRGQQVPAAIWPQSIVQLVAMTRTLAGTTTWRIKLLWLFFSEWIVASNVGTSFHILLCRAAWRHRAGGFSWWTDSTISLFPVDVSSVICLLGRLKSQFHQRYKFRLEWSYICNSVNNESHCTTFSTSIIRPTSTPWTLYSCF